MFRLFKIFLFISYVFITLPSAHAQKLNYFKVAEPWTPVTQQKYYGEGIPYNAHVFKAINSILYETPVSVFGMVIEEATNPASNQEISRIADECRRYAESWDRIACAAQNVEALLVNRNYGVFTAPCRAMSTTFIKVFRRLKIPHAWVGYKAANYTMPLGESRFPFPTFHVAVLTGVDGQVYSYVLDLAFYAQNLYPISMSAKEFYMTGTRQLPEI
jgi:hypothetical protein